MGKVAYTAARGDIVWLDFNPARGHEQAGVRPALVISDTDFNLRTGLVIVCPITSRKKGFLSEVPLQDTKTRGVVLAHHVRTLAARERNIRFVERAKDEAVEMVSALVNRIVGN